jgi:soluble lytic murein transglycosylase
MGGGEAEQAGCVFHRPGAGLGEKRVMQRQKPVLNGDRLGQPALRPGPVHGGAKGGRDIGGDADAAMASGSEEGERGVVLPRELTEMGADCPAGVERPGEIGGGVLDPDDVGDLGEAGHRLHAHVDDGARRDVVYDHRNVDRLGDGLEMQIKPLLRRFVVVGRDDQHPVGAGARGMGGEIDRLARAVGARPGDHRHPLGGRLDDDLDHPLVFVMAEGGRLAGRAHRHQPIGSLGDLPFHETPQRGLVDRAIGAHRRDQSDERSLEHDPLLGGPRPDAPHPPQPSLSPSRPSLPAEEGEFRQEAGSRARWQQERGKREGGTASRPRARLLALGVFLCALLPLAGGKLSAAAPAAPAAAAAPEAALGAALTAQRWDEARALAAAFGPLGVKLVDYFRLSTPGAAEAGEIVAFMAANPHWPGMETLARRRDEAYLALGDEARLAALCERAPPVMTEALFRCAVALHDRGAEDEALRLAVRAWREGLSGAEEEERLLAIGGRAIGSADDWAHFLHVLGRGEGAVERALARLGGAARERAGLILGLRANQAAAWQRVATLPPEAAAEPALFLESLRYLRRSGDDDAALALWQRAGVRAWAESDSSLRALLAGERLRLARRLLAASRGEAAFGLLELPLDPPPPLEAALDGDFLAGFIALESLGDPGRAAPHFAALARRSPAVITQARAHFWLAQSLARARRGEEAAAEYRLASAFPVTFYGQLAILALGEDTEGIARRLRALRDPDPDPEAVRELDADERWQAARLLAARWGMPERARPFFGALLREKTDGGAYALIAHRALGLGMPEAAVMAARLAGREGVMLPEAGWPIGFTPPPLPAPLDAATLLGLVRQESSFDPAAESPSGALGLTQLLPSTARMVAQKLGTPLAADAVRPALIGDPGRNLALGAAYLASLLDRYDGDLILAIAAYNAGPSAVAAWLAANGDPRRGAPSALEWIERIPYDETRNYVERVIENIAIYHVKRGERFTYPLSLPPGAG